MSLPCEALWCSPNRFRNLAAPGGPPVSPTRWPGCPGQRGPSLSLFLGFHGVLGSVQALFPLRAPLAGRPLGRRAVSAAVPCPGVPRAGQGRCPAARVPWVSRAGLPQPPLLPAPSLSPGSPRSAACLTTSVLERPRAWVRGGASMRRALRLFAFSACTPCGGDSPVPCGGV